MFMNFILISPLFPPNFQQFATRLREQGVTVLGIGSDPYDQLSDNLRNDLTEYYRVDDMEKWADVAKAVAFFYFKYGKIDRIESNNEYWLELDAFLRTEFNVFGLKSMDLQAVKYKSKMKENFKKAGAPTVEGLRVENAAETEQAIKELSYPVIAKPDSGVGSAATYRLDNEEDLTHFIETWDKKTPYFIEQFVEESELCTYDGLIDQEGNIVFETSFNYSMPTLDLLDAEVGVHYVIQREMDPKLRDLGRKIVKEFGHRERFFHVEFFRKADSSYITLEYNARLAGGFTIDLYNYAHSIDLYDKYAKIVSGKEAKKITEKPAYGIAVGRRDHYPYQHTVDEVREKYGDKLRMVERMPAAFGDLLGDTFLVLTTKDSAEMNDIIHFATD